MLSRQRHFEQLAHWLKLESKAETKQLKDRRKRASLTDPEQFGDSVIELAISNHEIGLGGRTLLTLVKRNRTLKMPSNRLRIGAPVVVSNEHGDLQQGVVCGKRSTSIQVAVDYHPEGKQFRIDLAPDEVTRKRQAAALRFAENAEGRLGELRDVLLGQRDPQFQPVEDIELSEHLNASQRGAIQLALAAEDLAIIHGPPGTGKTTTIVELIQLAVARGEKVLACAPSNTAVDNVLKKLIDSKQKVVRLGHPARVNEHLRTFTLDSLAAKHGLMEIVRDMIREADGLFRRAGRYTRSQPPPGAKSDMHREGKRLKADARMLEQQAIDSVLDEADIICATSSFNVGLLGSRHFDLLVIDEACQSTEPGCWAPLQKADRVVLAGDHCQLPPTVISATAQREGLEVSLLERLVNLYGHAVTRQLKVQYRMHRDIMQFSSARFYNDSLQAHESVASHLLSDLSHIQASPLTDTPAEFIDTAGADWVEELEPGGESKRNPSEAAFVLWKVEQLVAAGVPTCDIAIIAPYAAQVRWLRSHCQWSDIEIDTVDGFQGREKEAVVISCVRSNAIREIGFLGDARRMNVAMTRARRKLIIVGDTTTLGGHQFFSAVTSYFESADAYRSIWNEGYQW